MNEKRFTGGSYGVYDNYKGDRLLWSEWEEVTGIMNNLDLKARERGKALSKLHKENEQLKKDAKYWAKTAEARLKENKQIKDTIREAYNMERTMIGKSVLKQLRERIGIE